MAGLQVDRLRPIRARVLVGREQRSVTPIVNREEAILRRVQEYRAVVPADGQVGEDHRLGRRHVPLIAGRLLVIPDEAAGIRIEREYRAKKQVIAAGWIARWPAVRPAVAGAHEEQSCLRVVVDGVPGRAAAAGAERQCEILDKRPRCPPQPILQACQSHSTQGEGML